MLRPSISVSTLDRADDEAGEIVFAVGIEARHLRGFATEQRAPVLAAAPSEPFDDLLGDIGLQSARRQVVEEEQRPRALHEDVVHAVIDEIQPDGAMLRWPGTRPSASCRHHRRSTPESAVPRPSGSS